MAFIKCFCSRPMSSENMFALLFNSKFCFFSWVSSLWPAIIPIFNAVDPWVNVMEDLCRRGCGGAVTDRVSGRGRL